MSKYISHSVQETKNIVIKIIENKKDITDDGAFIIALEGELGAGKTQISQGVAAYLGIKRNITSPTFVIMKRYSLNQKDIKIKTFKYLRNFYHFDCYRINVDEEIFDLGWKDIISKKENIILVEWAERIKNIIPKNSIWIKIKNDGESEGKRIIVV